MGDLGVKGLTWCFCCNTRCSLKPVCARDDKRKVGDGGRVKFFHPVRGVDGVVSCTEFVKVERKR
jgi:hypothetical protein